jgi:hypothetical protein
MPAKTDDPELRRLTLQIERDLVAQSHLRILLTAAENTLAHHQHAIRTLNARVSRADRTNRR